MQISPFITRQLEANLKCYLPANYEDIMAEKLMNKGLNADSRVVHNFLCGQQVDHTHILFSTALELISGARKHHRRRNFFKRNIN